MAAYKKILPILLCFFLLILLPSSLYAAEADVYENDVFDVSGATQGAGDFIKAALPDPQIGNEQELFALLRGGFLQTNSEYMQNYLAKLHTHYANGGLQSQPLAQTAQQALVLLAAGINLPEFDPNLAATLANAEAINAEGFAAQYFSLLLFSVSGTNIGEQISLDINSVSAAFAARQQEDGGFSQDGASNAKDTALAVQALARFPALETNMRNAHAWLMLRTNDFGGFEENGATSPEATANAMVAMDMLKNDPSFIDLESGNMLVPLLMFKAENGGFFKDPDTPPDTKLTASCLLALVAKQRYIRKEKTLFDFSDVTQNGYLPPQDGNWASGQDIDTFFSGGTAANPWPFVIVAAALAVALCLFLVFMRGGKESNTDKPKKNKYTSFR